MGPVMPMQFPHGSRNWHMAKPPSMVRGPRYRAAPHDWSAANAALKSGTSQYATVPAAPEETFSSAGTNSS